MGLRNRGRPAGTTYVMREKLFSLGDEYWIETAGGQRAIKVDGRALRRRDTLVLEDASGRELCRIQERRQRVRDAMTIDLAGGARVTVKKRLIGVRDRFAVVMDGGKDLEVRGNVVDHEYELKRDGLTVAEVSKRWVRAPQTYAVQIGPGQNEALILAATVCLERMAQD
jgi:uncharacterized protein YxjI